MMTLDPEITLLRIVVIVKPTGVAIRQWSEVVRPSRFLKHSHLELSVRKPRARAHIASLKRQLRAIAAYALHGMNVREVKHPGVNRIRESI